MSGYIIEKTALQSGDLALINRFTRRTFSESEVYTFSVLLCDNEVDRDFDRFSLQALAQLKDLFVGKTCIFDHERKSANQTARIFDTQIQTEKKQTAWGELYTKLTAKAYLPITDKTQEFITSIESGILKEVSVSCAVKDSKCSICGKDSCSHQKGVRYNNQLCHQIFEQVSDAYECSFVAVPAQRAAGVTKSFGKGVGNMQEILKSFRQGEAVSISSEQAKQISSYLGRLEEKALWGEKYREDLHRQILKYSGLIQPELPRAVMESALQPLSIQDLKTMEAVYTKMTEKELPVRPQLWGKKSAAKEAQDNEFKI